MRKVAKRAPKRRLFDELMSGVQAIRDHREGRVTLRSQRVEPIAVPTLNPMPVRGTSEALRKGDHDE